MKTESSSDTELVPLNPIRVETGLSRQPLHRLARKGNIEISIREGGETTWEVDYSKKHGQPGPLAYKLDTLIINRRIEEAIRPIPRLLKLGSLSDICRELNLSDSGKNRSDIKKSLYQNAFAGITTKTRYKLADGSETELEAAFTRYGVIFTGEKLPNGNKADGVYISLNDVFIRVINGAMTRPLDYDYLKSLPPAPQRFYELLSFQIYAAIKHERPRAKLIYSDFCAHAPQTRHTEWKRVRSQMSKVIKPHLASGYIGKVEYQDTVDRDGQPDWIMLYQPGLKAKAEFRSFNKRGGPTLLEIEPLDDTPPGIAPELTPLEMELVEHGIDATIARQLVAAYDDEKIRHQIEILDWRLAGKNASKITDPAAWLVSAIRSPNGHALPKGFVSRAERQRREEEKQAKERQEAEERRRKQLADAEARKERAAISGFWDGLTPEQQAEHEAAAIAQADAEDLKLIEPGPMKRFGMTIIRDKYAKKLLQAQGKLPAIEA